ncbi:Ephrin-A2 ELF-1 EPH-related receptor tyrosine kinase ligand 6 [Collichthys lucidus]|uniref:Ephrin-A2 ELF-1 EPH-related receptor tyrosine kinase ligand 6 n=1 Tax=Collichthys lucidus TaxID=240159 RepID=A0A4U5VFP7_COLLU|nr:Ephrin-A2 ELF-1 EPH-related receptor tyrosine kinase ligand 6 [Collichthys lucidus]
MQKSNRLFWHGEYRVAVNINDYLDIYCPYYEGPPSHGRMERYILFMVNHEGYTSCQHRMRGFKRWECNRPSASPHPNHVGRACLKLKVYVRPPDGSGYDSPEPFLTDGGLGWAGCPSKSTTPQGSPLSPSFPLPPPPPLYNHQPPPLPAPSTTQPRTPFPGLAERVGP